MSRFISLGICEAITPTSVGVCDDLANLSPGVSWHVAWLKWIVVSQRMSIVKQDMEKLQSGLQFDGSAHGLLQKRRYMPSILKRSGQTSAMRTRYDLLSPCASTSCSCRLK